MSVQNEDSLKSGLVVSFTKDKISLLSDKYKSLSIILCIKDST